MGKRCVVCEEEAIFMIKNTSEYYCDECAVEHFADLSMLVKVEEEARRLKEYIKEKLNDPHWLEEDESEN